MTTSTEQLKALLDEGTQGAARVRRNNEYSSDVVVHTPDGGVAARIKVFSHNLHDDARNIALSHNLMPELIAVAEAAELANLYHRQWEDAALNPDKYNLVELMGDLQNANAAVAAALTAFNAKLEGELENG